MLTFLNMQETREIHLPTHLREIHLRSVLIRSNSLCWLDKSLASVISYSRLLVASAHMCPYFPVAQQRYSYNLIHFSGLCIVYCTWLPFPFCCTIIQYVRAIYCQKKYDMDCYLACTVYQLTHIDFLGPWTPEMEWLWCRSKQGTILYITSWLNSSDVIPPPLI